MSAKKLIKRISLFCFFVAFCISIGYRVQNYINTQQQKTILQKNKLKNQNYTEIPYLEIPKYQLTKIIKDSVEPKVLDQKYVGIWNQNKDLRKRNHIVLAGHNVRDVFGKIKHLQTGDVLILHFKDVIFYYEVEEKKIISVQETYYLEETSFPKLTLVTCVEDDQKRLLVIGKLKHKG